MKIFVFTNVLADYASGIAMIAAENLEQAQQLAFEKFEEGADSLEYFLSFEPGFREADAIYETTSVTEAKVLHHLYGSC